MKHYASRLLPFIALAALGATVSAQQSAPSYGLDLGSGLFAVGPTSGGQQSLAVKVIVGPDKVAQKHIAGFKWEDIAIGFCPGGTDPLEQFLMATLSGKFAPLNGSYVVLAKGKPDGNACRVKFSNAKVNEIDFPGMDFVNGSAGLGLTKCTPEKVEANSDSLRTVDGGGIHLPQVNVTTTKSRILMEGSPVSGVLQSSPISIIVVDVDQDGLPDFVMPSRFSVEIDGVAAQPFVDWASQGGSGAELRKSISVIFHNDAGSEAMLTMRCLCVSAQLPPVGQHALQSVHVVLEPDFVQYQSYTPGP